MTSQPGWYSDPTSRHQHRYWDGSYWTATVSDNGSQSYDPLDAPIVAARSTQIPAGSGGLGHGGAAESGGLLRRLFNTGGRFNRGEFALLYLGTAAVGWVLVFVSAFIAEAVQSEVPLMLSYLWLPVQATVAIFAGIRRCHDIGWPGTYLLLAFVPLANIVMMLLFLFKPGRPLGSTPWG